MDNINILYYYKKEAVNIYIYSIYKREDSQTDINLIDCLINKKKRKGEKQFKSYTEFSWSNDKIMV